MRVVRKIINYAAALVFIGLALLVPLTSMFSGTSVSFQSSDGRWTDGEVLGKGRKFETVVTLFEAYKIKCNVPEVTLHRVTPKPKALMFDNLFNREFKFEVQRLT